MITKFENPAYFYHDEFLQIRDGGLVAAMAMRDQLPNMNLIPAWQLDKDQIRIGFVKNTDKIQMWKLDASRSALIFGTEKKITVRGVVDKNEISPGIDVCQRDMHEIDESQLDRIRKLFENKQGIQSQIDLNKSIIQRDQSGVLNALQSGADVNYDSIVKGVWDTPLVRAIAMLYSLDDAGGARTAIIKTLIENGADVNQRGPKGHTALMLLSSYHVGHKLISYMIESGAIVNAQDDSGDTAFMQAARCPESKFQVPTAMKYLLDAGADPLMKNKRGKNALHAAVAAGATSNIGILKTLIDGTALNNAINTKRNDAGNGFAESVGEGASEDVVPQRVRRPGIL